MADFIPDGHKYGWKLKEPWGLSPSSKDRFNLYVSNVRFTIKTNGGGSKVLGLLGTWAETAAQQVYDGHPAQVYFKLGYQEDGSVPWTYTVLDSSPVGQPLEANQYLARLTVSNKSPAKQTSDGITQQVKTGVVSWEERNHLWTAQNMFNARPVDTAHGHCWSWTSLKTQGKSHDWDLCFEFSVDKSPEVTKFSVCIDNGYDVEEISPDNGFILYLDDYQELQSGGGSMTQPADPRSVKTIAQPGSMSLLYKHTNGALYQLDTSAYATQAEYQSLLARVAALEAAKAGA